MRTIDQGLNGDKVWSGIILSKNVSETELTGDEIDQTSAEGTTWPDQELIGKSLIRNEPN